MWALVLALEVAFARVFVGLHWPTDALFGGVVGIVGLVVLASRWCVEWLATLVFRVLRVPDPNQQMLRLGWD